MKRHRFDPFSLLFGGLLAALGLVFVLSRVQLDELHFRWVWPIPLIVIGALVIFLGARAERADRRHAQVEPSADDEIS